VLPKKTEININNIANKFLDITLDLYSSFAVIKTKTNTEDSNIPFLEFFQM
jgi:hypothetical protein